LLYAEFYSFSNTGGGDAQRHQQGNAFAVVNAAANSRTNPVANPATIPNAHPIPNPQYNSYTHSNSYAITQPYMYDFILHKPL
jgi:hypothetical protein